MPDYSRKRCVVCSQVGGIEAKDDGLFVCKHCGTPYRPRTAKISTEPDTDTPKIKPSRYVWFSYTDNGQPRAGLYDCPLVPDAIRPTLEEDKNKLKFLKFLVTKGHLTGDTTPDGDH